MTDALTALSVGAAVDDTHESGEDGNGGQPAQMEGAELRKAETVGDGFGRIEKAFHKMTSEERRDLTAEVYGVSGEKDRYFVKIFLRSGKIRGIPETAEHCGMGRWAFVCRRKLNESFT